MISVWSDGFLVSNQASEKSLDSPIPGSTPSMAYYFFKLSQTIFLPHHSFSTRKNPPEEPYIYGKPVSSYIVEESSDPIFIPNGYIVKGFVNLGVVIGKEAKCIEEGEVESYIGGYCVALDLLAENQLDKMRKKALPWLSGKCFDTSCPVSKLVGTEKIKNPSNIDIWFKVNGEVVQRGCTKDMIFSICDIITYLTRFMTLHPNDLILAGCPPTGTQLCHDDEIETGISDITSAKFKVHEESQLY